MMVVYRDLVSWRGGLLECIIGALRGFWACRASRACVWCEVVVNAPAPAKVNIIDKPR